jgi:hypothetical protein
MKLRMVMAVAACMLAGTLLWLVLRQKAVSPPLAALPQATLSRPISIIPTNLIQRAVAKPALDSIPPRCAIILGQEDGISFNVRYAALKELRPPLTSNEVQALYLQLYRHSDEDPVLV